MANFLKNPKFKLNLKSPIRPNQKRQKIIGGLFLPILAVGFFVPWIGFSILGCMVAGLIISIKNGRKWCDFFCPRGAFFDAYLSKISSQKSIPQFLYQYKIRIPFILLLFSFLSYNIYNAWPSISMIGFAFVKTLLLTTFLSIVFGIFFRARMWCVLCPVGTFSGLIGGKKNKLYVDFGKCLNCTNCARVCPMGLCPFKDKLKKTLQSRDCIKCGTCVKNCPTGALRFKK